MPLEGVGLKDTRSAFWDDRPVLLTGGAGFIGSAIGRELAQRGAALVLLVRDKVADHLQWWREWRNVVAVDGDIESFETVLRVVNDYHVETVFHLAAQTAVGTAKRSPISTLQTNVMGTLHVLEAARTIGTVRRVVVASSDKAYGDSETLPYVEALPMAGLFPYEASKSCADLIARTYHRTYGMAVCVTRCANVYGPGHRNWTTIIPGTIKSLHRGERPVIRSDGTLVRDYLFVEDCVDGYLTLAEAMEQPPVHGLAFNISAELPMTVLQVVDHISRAMNRMDLEPDVRNEAKAEIRAQHLSAARAREMLGWRARHTFEQGLAKTIPWYVEFLNASRGH